LGAYKAKTESYTLQNNVPFTVTLLPGLKLLTMMIHLDHAQIGTL